MVIGVPVGVELARLGGWRIPFWAIGGLGLRATISAMLVHPPMHAHLAQPEPAERAGSRSYTRPIELWAHGITALANACSFLVLPNISAFVQENLGDAREHLGLLYLYGGFSVVLLTKPIGHLVDRIGSRGVGTLGAGLGIAVLLAGFCYSILPPEVMMVGFMSAMAFRPQSDATVMHPRG